VTLQTFRDIRPETGAIANGWVDVPGLDPSWRLPVVVVRGRKPGPTLALSAGVHACEYAPMEALRQFVLSIDRSQLSGVVIAVLQVNVPGFFSRTVFVNPRDGKNINRVFPGSRSGTPAERVTDFLMTELVQKVDAYIDCHCGDMVEALIPFTLWARTGNADVDAQSQLMATAYGESMIFEGILESSRGMAWSEAEALGTPAILAEAGQQGICDDGSVQIHLNGMYSVLAALGMSEAKESRPNPRAMAAKLSIAANSSGVFRALISLGDQVVLGQKVAEIRDVFGGVLEDIIAPTSGVVFVLLTGLAVSAGEALMQIGVFREGEAP
jgi:predicted deacylase